MHHGSTMVSGQHLRVFTVLVVEDDPDLRELFGIVLRSGGFHVEEASTLSAALALARKRKPDVAILDRDLPDGDGFEVARALRASSTRTMALTARTEERSRAAAYEAGCDAFIAKPCGPRELLASVRALLALQPALESQCG